VRPPQASFFEPKPEPPILTVHSFTRTALVKHGEEAKHSGTFHRLARLFIETLTNINPSTIQDYNVGVTLGTGSFGRVRFATDTETGQGYAVKILKKSEVVRLEQVEHINSEKTILEGLDHPYIVKLAGTFQDQLHLYMVLEYIVGGEFFTHLRKNGRFDNATSRFYAAQIVMIFEYMHGLNIIYRDLKPENLLLDKSGYLKITGTFPSSPFPPTDHPPTTPLLTRGNHTFFQTLGSPRRSPCAPSPCAERQSTSHRRCC
jgi:serine/threonine protein kinase